MSGTHSCWVDVENGAGVKYGDGPIFNVINWQSTAQLSKAGTFTLSVPASDQRAALLIPKRVVRCYAMVGGAATEIGAGIIDGVRWDGANTLVVSGSDLLAELRYRSVHELNLVTETRYTPTKVFSYSGSTWTDMVAAYDGVATFGVGNRVSFDLGAIDDFLYIGYSAPFNVVYTYQDAGASSTIWNTVASDLNYGYSDGAGGWPELKVVSDTQIVGGVPWPASLVTVDPVASGDNVVLFQRNANWQAETVNGVSAYWIRVDPTENIQEVSIVEFVVGVRSNLLADVAAIMDYAPTAWADWDADADSTTIFDATAEGTYAAFAGELVLSALVKIAKRAGESFRLGAGRTLHWLHTSGNAFASSGMRAIGSNGSSGFDLDAYTCHIVSIEETRDTSDLITRIYPFGSGNGKARVTLVNATLAMPTGYSMDAANNYIKRDTASPAAGESLYGQIERIMAFKDIRPTDDLTFDSVDVCNQLASLTLNYLERHCTVNYFYRLTVTGLSAILRVGETIRVVYREVHDGVLAVNIDADLIILSETHTFSARGLYTVSMSVGTTDAWPASDAEIIADMIEQGVIYESHPQAIASGMVKALDV